MQQEYIVMNKCSTEGQSPKIFYDVRSSYGEYIWHMVAALCDFHKCINLLPKKSWCK